MSRHGFLDHPGPIALAHRGGAGPWPENSWPAFEHAVALGYRYLETDVRATRDGTAMILHDSTLARVADRPGRLADLPLAEASRIRLRQPPSAVAAAASSAAISAPASRTSSDSPDRDGERIPRLDELLDRWPRMRFNLDVKEPGALEPTIAALRRANALDRVCVTSFDDAVAREARRLAGPELCVGAGMSAIAVARLCSVVPPWLAAARRSAGPRGPVDAHRHGTADRARALVPAQTVETANGNARRPRRLAGRDVVQVPVAFRSLPVCDARFVRYMTSLGLPVHVWTVNDEASMSMLLDLGVDGIITDRPELLRDVLMRRDLWSPA